MDLSAAWISLRLAAATTLLLAGLGLPLAWWIAARGPRHGFVGDVVGALWGARGMMSTRSVCAVVKIGRAHV